MPSDYMKKLVLTILTILLCFNGWTDIGPNPIAIKSIMTSTPCEIQMVSEIVNVELYNDSSIVTCVFRMKNHGDSITLPVGFPVMNFFHWNIKSYSSTDKDIFEISVDNIQLDRNAIQVPQEMKSIYQQFMLADKADKILAHKHDSIDSKYGVIQMKNRSKVPKTSENKYYKALKTINDWRAKQPDNMVLLEDSILNHLNRGNYPWYIWNVHFSKNESRTIRVSYKVPSGLYYKAKYRYFNYLISTGTGWKGKIEKADITIRLHNIKVRTIEKISPSNHILDKESKSISWVFMNIEPTKQDDIYVQYYNPKERRWFNDN